MSDNDVISDKLLEYLCYPRRCRCLAQPGLGSLLVPFRRAEVPLDIRTVVTQTRLPFVTNGSHFKHTRTGSCFFTGIYFEVYSHNDREDIIWVMSQCRNS